MWKAALAGVAMIAIAGTSLVYAQQRRPDGDQARGSEFDQFRRWRPTAEDVSALADARVASLKAALRLTPEQEKNWPPLEQAIRDMMKQRFDRMTARRDSPPPADPIERMRARAQAMAQMATGMQHLADAAAPLYQSLNDGQKRRLALVMRGARSMGPMMGHGRMGRGGGWGGPDRGPGRGPGMGPGMGPRMGPGPGRI